MLKGNSGAHRGGGGVARVVAAPRAPLLEQGSAVETGAAWVRVVVVDEVEVAA